jgi:hypothetical protein
MPARLGGAPGRRGSRRCARRQPQGSGPRGEGPEPCRCPARAGERRGCGGKTRRGGGPRRARHAGSPVRGGDLRSLTDNVRDRRAGGWGPIREDAGGLDVDEHAGSIGPRVASCPRTHGSGGPMPRTAAHLSRSGRLPLRLQKEACAGYGKPLAEGRGDPGPVAHSAHLRPFGGTPRPDGRRTPRTRRRPRQMGSGVSSWGCWTMSSPSTFTTRGWIRRTSTSPCWAAWRAASAVG